MPSIFTTGRGVVQKLEEGRTPAPFRIKMDNSTGFQKAIVTQVGIMQNDNFQFLHTLSNAIYVYIFGTRIGELTVGGIAFAGACGDTAGKPSGFREILENYKTKRIAKNTTTVTVAIGDVAFNGFLTGMSAQVVDAEHILTQWTYRFAVLPES